MQPEDNIIIRKRSKLFADKATWYKVKEILERYSSEDHDKETSWCGSPSSSCLAMSLIYCDTTP
jgi:hypothetical protein